MDDRCICTALRRAAAQSTAYYDAALAPSGIKVTMFRLLRRIDAAGSISITELARIVGLDRSTLGRNLRVLEKQALVEIGTGVDARARRVCLTRTGHERLRKAVPLWRQAQLEFSQIVGADALAVLDRVIVETGEEERAIGGSA
jgi:DNA-binding MarR family transcriptional regulator